MSPESFPREREEQKSVESQANYEGNDTVLLLERVKHPIIKDQIIDLLFQCGADEAIKEAVEMVVGEYVAPSREQIGEELEKRLHAVETDTPIIFENKQPGAGRMFGGMEREFLPLNWRFPSGASLTPKQKSIIEAHEKGHVIRPYSGTLFRVHFSPGFDRKAPIFTEEDYEMEKNVEGKRLNRMTYKRAKQRFLQYLFMGAEVAERMSQLKNYFGFQGNQKFTKEHLNYAKEHYVRDTEFDNRMSHFFQAITSEKEEEFLRLMNSSGI